MTESEFNQRVDDVLRQIEDSLEECGVDIDYESAGGILTLEFDNDSRIIINRQTPLKQIWVAARQGGFHFDYHADRGQWVLQGEDSELFAALSDYCSHQAGETVRLSAG